jgi:ribosomal protein S18 acetylase RimI-like enzyme
MARLLSDGVCNAYLLDVWTMSAYRRRGIASSMVRLLADQVPGQHIGLQTDDAVQFYASLGFRPQPSFMSLVAGTWLDNGANRIQAN